MEAGQDPSAFWSKTLRIIMIVLDACVERDRRAHNDRAWLAHQTAFLTSYHPTKPERFTKLDRLQVKAKKPGGGKVRDWEDDFAAMSAWASKSVH